MRKVQSEYGWLKQQVQSVSLEVIKLQIIQFNFLYYISTFSTVYTVWDKFIDMVAANQYAVFLCILLIIQERVRNTLS